MKNEKVKTTTKNSKFTKVLKFGGSSVGNAERIKNVCKIISDASKKDRAAAVVSAMQGVTDKLLALDFNFVKEKHLAASKELKIPAPVELLNELENVIKGIKLLGDASPMALDLVASFGERLSANLVAAAFNKLNAKRYTLNAIPVDSRELVKTDNNFQNAAVDFQKTNRNIKKYFSKFLIHNSQFIIPVVTGFIGSTDTGKTTTLGRGGSDYSAAIFGAALSVDVVEIWTDADGIMTADPRIVPAAFTLPEISYEDAFEMAYFGAKVIHPATMVPAIKKSIPILIKNTFNPSHPGTVISKSKVIARPYIVKNVSALEDISLISIGGTNLAGIPGTAERVFKAVAEKKVNVILIAQASSEHTICFAVKKSEADKTKNALKEEFENEIRRGKVFIEKEDRKSIIAVVGDNMRGVPGIAGKIFDTLGKKKINISAIAQGGSERNISFVIDQTNKIPAIQALHQEFFASPAEVLTRGAAAIFIVGVGNVGGELLKQIYHSNILKNVRMIVCGVGDVNKMHFEERGIDLKNWKKLLIKSPEKMDFNKFVEKARAISGSHKIFVDCTASNGIAKKYAEIVRAGFHIITPNKKANVLPMKQYQALRKTLAEHKKEFHYDANVGAGLPIIASIKKLTAAGDKIKNVEGIFSGTLSYLFNNFDGRRKFSELVAEAKAKGYTEPDPREDLSGKDVGRKLLILARELGWPLEFSDVKLENLATYSDQQMAQKFRKSKAKNCVLRYVGAIANNKLSAKLKEVPADSPLAHVSGTDNIVAIYSKYYKNPLVIKGAGAGREITAATVLDGIMKVIK
jgi:aspartokinase/homoserine dehydrogenase 1